MQTLEYVDHRKDPGAWANELGISREAVDLYLDSEVFDFHLDTFIWHRIFGYDLTARHDNGLFSGRFYSEVDLPRIREARVGGGCWVITTNPARVAVERAQTFVQNLAELRGIFASVPNDVQFVTSVAEYKAARAEDKHAAFIGIQGGNALDRDLEALDLIPDRAILRITLVHLSSSRIGVTSSPLARGKHRGLTPFGRDYVRRLNAKKIFVDLAHISREGFFDAVEAHDKRQPLLVTHTGVTGVHPHWRNIDDDQIRAIAETDGTIGVMYQSDFLEPGKMWGGSAVKIVEHLEHIVKVGGEDRASLGSDWDGMICPPRDMQTPLELPRLVEIMLKRGWKSERVKKVLGGNALRTIEALRG
ncbi:MAG: dipeptidase [Polyangiales bacterium]